MRIRCCAMLFLLSWYSKIGWEWLPAMNFCTDRQPSKNCFAELLDDFRDSSSAHGATAFANGEAQALLHGHRRVQCHFQRDVVARHHHLRAFRQLRRARNVSGAEV